MRSTDNKVSLLLRRSFLPYAAEALKDRLSTPEIANFYNCLIDFVAEEGNRLEPRNRGG